ncbi:MAG: hypothetical protein ABSA77_12985 [Thermoguttaceae bacterium]|jgi:hypothetical protein
MKLVKQWCWGIISKIAPNKHIYLNDFDNCTLEDCKADLTKMVIYAKQKYNIDFNYIYLLSDKKKSYRVISFTILTTNQLIDLIAYCLKSDYNFFNTIYKKKKAVLRISIKKNRIIKPIHIMKYGELGDFSYKTRKELYQTGND